MEIFKSNIGGMYIITNYKVMSSTLRRQPNLSIVPVSDSELRMKILLNKLSQRSKFYLIVRNPYDRIESFYKNKFLEAEANRIRMTEMNKPKKWQGCTEHFFPLLGLDWHMDPKMVSSVLAKANFDDIVRSLPDVYLKDPHMVPQFKAEKIRLEMFGVGLSIRIKFARVFKMEDANDIAELGSIFNMDLSQRANKTSDAHAPVVWTPESLQIVNTLYARDFTAYAYDIRPSGQ